MIAKMSAINYSHITLQALARKRFYPSLVLTILTKKDTAKGKQKIPNFKPQEKKTKETDPTQKKRKTEKTKAINSQHMTPRCCRTLRTAARTTAPSVADQRAESKTDEGK